MYDFGCRENSLRGATDQMQKKKKISLYDVAQQCFHAQALNVRASLSIETLMSFLMII